MATITNFNLEENQMKIYLNVQEFEANLSVSFFFKHSWHSFIRAAQRGVTLNSIRTTLQYGKSVYKQGLIFYILGQSNIPESLCKEMKKLVNTIVIVSGTSNEIITCYRSSDPFKYIRKKSKRLVKKYLQVA